MLKPNQTDVFFLDVSFLEFQTLVTVSEGEEKQTTLFSLPKPLS